MTKLILFYKKHSINCRHSKQNLGQRKQTKDIDRRSPSQGLDNKPGDDLRKANANNIDENAWHICNKVWTLLESPVNDNDETLLNERLTEIQVKKN